MLAVNDPKRLADERQALLAAARPKREGPDETERGAALARRIARAHSKGGLGGN